MGYVNCMSTKFKSLVLQYIKWAILNLIRHSVLVFMTGETLLTLYFSYKI